MQWYAQNPLHSKFDETSVWGQTSMDIWRRCSVFTKSKWIV